MRVQPLPTAVAVVAVVALLGSASAQEVGPLAIAKQGYFFVGGKYFDTPNGNVMAGHAYVEYLIPQNRTHRFPLVMIAGGAMSGANFTGTPDGRMPASIADARPALVKAIVAIEAGMRPFRNVEFLGAPDYFRDGPVDKLWGLGNVPLTFAPQVSNPSELAVVKQEKPDAPDLVACILQKEPA